MYIVIFTSLLALLLTFLDSKKIMPNGMKWGFVLVTFLGCIHYDYGNDYMAYMGIYKDIIKHPFDFEDLIGGYIFKEPGWAFLCYLFKPVGGFFMMVAMLNVLQNVLVYKTIKRYVKRTWWPVSIFIYLFSTCLYLLNFSMMRQGLVVCIFLGVWPWIEQKKWVKASIVLLFCCTIHKSALILLPFAFWEFIPKNSKLLSVAFITFFVFLWWKGESLMVDLLLPLMDVEELGDYVATYGNNTEIVTFGIGYMINQIPFVLGLLYILQHKGDEDSLNESNKSLVFLSMISFLIAPFMMLIPLIARMSFYFISYHVIAIPVVYGNLKNKLIRGGLVGLYLFMMFYDYWGWYQSPIWIEKYTTFKTIFSQVF